MYKLLLIGCFAPWRTNSSCEFFSDELTKRFSKLPVDLITQHFDVETFPEADIALVHAYDTTVACQRVSEIKKKVKKVVLFMEEPKYEFGFDHCYFYNKAYLKYGKGTYIRIPLVKEYYTVAPKESGSILLDHDSQLFIYHNSANHDWNERFWTFFEENEQYRPVYQLERGNVTRPDFIKTIPMQSHKDYLRATDHIETFISTHAGSYNHTAVDMAVRGMNLIVPYSSAAQYNSFIPQCLVDDLGLIQVDDEKIGSILDAIKSGSIKKKQDRSFIDLATDLDEVVSLLDKDFKLWLGIKAHKSDSIMLL